MNNLKDLERKKLELEEELSKFEFPMFSSERFRYDEIQKQYSKVKYDIFMLKHNKAI